MSIIFDIINHGSVVSFWPIDDAAQDWWDTNVSECPMLGNRYVVEARYAGDIIEGIADAQVLSNGGRQVELEGLAGTDVGLVIDQEVRACIS